MKAELEKLQNGLATLSVEVDAGRVNTALEEAYRRLVKRVNVPGFRKGKAPRPILERHVGKAALWNEALDGLLAESYRAAVASTGIEPVDEPRFQVERMADGEPLVFKATVWVRPEVRLGDYRSITASRQVPEVTAADVERYLERMREGQARLEVEEGASVREGHFVVVSYEILVDGAPLRGGRGEQVMFQVGAGQLPPEVERGLLGMRPGDEGEIPFALPDGAGEGLAGKTGVFKVQLHEVKRKVLPALDDDFARQLGEYASLEELRSEAENRLRLAAERKADEELAGRVVQEVVERSEVSVPPVLVDRRMDTLLRRWLAELRQAGIAPGDYLAAAGVSAEDFQNDLRRQAEAEVRAELVIDAVAKAEGIEASDGEVQERLQAAGLSQDVAMIVRRSIIREKAAVFLKELAEANARAEAS